VQDFWAEDAYPEYKPAEHDIASVDTYDTFGATAYQPNAGGGYHEDVYQDVSYQSGGGGGYAGGNFVTGGGAYAEHTVYTQEVVTETNMSSQPPPTSGWW